MEIDNELFIEQIRQDYYRRVVGRTYKTFIIYPHSKIAELKAWAEGIDDSPDWDHLEFKFIDNENSSAGMLFWVATALNGTRKGEYKFVRTFKNGNICTMYFSRYQLQDL